MPKLETWKDTTEVVMARRVHSMESLPGNIIDGSQCIYSNEIQKPDKDICSMPKKAFNNFRIASLDGQMQSCVLVIGHCIDVFTLGNNSIDDADVTFLGSYVNTPRSLSVEEK